MATIWCLGSINVDTFYDVPHIPAPGETLAATAQSIGLGGKGANQSVAAAKAGARVEHIGGVGEGAGWIMERLKSYGVGTGHIAVLDVPTGHAIINVAADGENAIVILAGANGAQDADRLRAALSGARQGDILLLQNETNLQPEAAEIAKNAGLRVLYSAAPFDAEAVKAVLPHIDGLLVNEIEARQLEQALGVSLGELGVADIFVTLGANGARYLDARSGQSVDAPGLKVRAVDTTGAGDTFAGYLAAGLAAGLAPASAMKDAVKAAALKVTQKGTADAIPLRSEVDAFSP